MRHPRFLYLYMPHKAYDNFEKVGNFLNLGNFHIETRQFSKFRLIIHLMIFSDVETVCFFDFQLFIICLYFNFK